jgi:hypothetical protein
MPLLSSIAEPFQAHADSPGESNAAIDDENTAMTAIVAPSEAERGEQDQWTEWPKGGHLAARSLHRVSILRRYQEAAEGVQQDMDADSGTAAFRQRLRDLEADRTLLVEILSVCDRLAR